MMVGQQKKSWPLECLCTAIYIKTPYSTEKDFHLQLVSFTSAMRLSEWKLLQSCDQEAQSGFRNISTWIDLASRREKTASLGSWMLWVSKNKTWSQSVLIRIWICCYKVWNFTFQRLESWEDGRQNNLQMLNPRFIYGLVGARETNTCDDIQRGKKNQGSIYAL